MILKLIGMGIKGYINDLMNIFDGFIVVISIIEMILEYI